MLLLHDSIFLQVDLGNGITISKIMFSNLRKGKLRHFILDLMKCVFGEEEFLQHSLSGRKPKISGDQRKPKINPLKQLTITGIDIL